MSVFALEALDAASGDALLVHFGSAGDPGFVLVDGGFGYTYDDVLHPRLDDLRETLDPAGTEPLGLACVVVSHVDDDHISGVVRLFDAVADDRRHARPPEIVVERAWHNSFDDAVERVTGARVATNRVGRRIDVEAAGIDSGRQLRNLVEFLGLDGNQPFGELMVGPRQIQLDSLEITLVGPLGQELDDLRDEWAKHVAQLDQGTETEAQAAAYLDDSIPNLSSIVLHVRQGGRTMLLTGDARGDRTLVGLEATGLLAPQGKMSVDVLKLPHHGSFRDVDTDYFERIVAEHYVISGNGRHQNPDPKTLELLVKSQGERSYTIHLTYEVEPVLSFLDSDRAQHARNYDVVVRDPADRSLLVAVEGKPI